MYSKSIANTRYYYIKIINMANVTLKKLKKVYDKDVVAVQDFDLEINDKEFIVLVGPSGCGKSTTLRMIAGLEDISGGELYIDGNLMNDVMPKDRDIAMVFQNYALYPHLSVYENMAFALKLRKIDKAIIDERVKTAAEILDITNLLERKPKALSGGQRQRVAIGRAIVRDPKVFLMDEPLSNLDAKLRNQMRTEIMKLRQRIDTTFIYVTHDQIEAMTLGDRIVIMRDGFVQQIGTPQEVFNHPKNIFVAGFIGSPQMNFFEGVLNKKDSNYSVTFSNKEFNLCKEMSDHFNKTGVENQNVTIGIRPDHLYVSNNEAGITAFCEVEEMMGSEVYVHTKSENDESVVIKMPTTNWEETLKDHEKHKSVTLSFNSELIHIFSKETQLNLMNEN